MTDTERRPTLWKSLYSEIRCISRIKNNLSLDVTVTLMVSLVLSKLDYGNALLSGLSLDQLYKLQKVQSRCLNNPASQYLQDLLHLKHKNSTRDFRSSNDKTLLFIPRSK